jgi:hypothetical protein
MRRPCARAFGLLLMVLLLAGCVSSPATPAADAKALCQSAFGSMALNSAPGTVEDLRTTTVGPPPPPPGRPLGFANAFPKAEGRQTIGWCWTGKPGNYELYAVTTGYKPIRVEGLAGQSETKTPSPGPAAIPYAPPATCRLRAIAWGHAGARGLSGIAHASAANRPFPVVGTSPFAWIGEWRPNTPIH